MNVVDQKGNPVDRLNELEYLPEENVVLANVWYKDYIVAINPQTGTRTVLQWCGVHAVTTILHR